MCLDIQFLGAAGEVTGSCHLLRVGGRKILLDCGLIQGGHEDEARNRAPFPFNPAQIDAVVLSHSHLDHSGRLPLLLKAGFRGHIYTQRASRDLCRIMLKDAGFLNEKDAEWENRKRQRKGLELVEPLYTVQDAQDTMHRIRAVDYDTDIDIVPGVRLRLHDAGHILGSSIIDLHLQEGDMRRRLVFSGDLGHRGAPILRDPVIPSGKIDLVLLESTYGDRDHRPWRETWDELGSVLHEAAASGGNILIPSFAVGRSQELLYAFARHYKEWDLDRWQVFLDSPMAIEASEVYSSHTELYDSEAARLLQPHDAFSHLLPNFHPSRTANQSMALNRIRSGAIVIAGSGMCTGGRIRHHFKHNLWREDTHVIMVGFQVRGTLGRALVDGAQRVQLWGETIRVAAKIHTIGGLSAHAGQRGLVDWYAALEGRPPLALVHGEPEATSALEQCMQGTLQAPVFTAVRGQRVDLEKRYKTKH